MNFQMIIAAMDKDANLDMDMALRMQILEGALNRPKGEFNRTRRDIGAALKELPLQYPEIDDSWFQIKDFGFYDAVFGGVRQVIKKDTGILTAEGLTQHLLGGITPIFSKPMKNDLMRGFGKNKSTEILNGSATVTTSKRTLFRYAKKRAYELWNSEQRAKHKRPEGPAIQEEGQMGLVDEVIHESPLQLLVTMMDSRYGQKIKNIVFNLIEQKGSPAKRALFEALLDNPLAGPVELANHPLVIDAMGVTTSQNISNHLRAIKKLLAKEMETNTQVRDSIEDAVEMGLDLQDLSRGQVRFAQDPVARFWMKLRLAAQAIKVAHRFLHL